MLTGNKKNPASGFLLMAVFNVVASLAFTIFYFLYKGSGGENSYYFIIAAVVSLIASIGLVIVYKVFSKKLQS